ncbi:lytic murein transglycosylase [Komagataeibacter xylinus]|uniref:Lytic murein transglycosylase n=1 Tax=Komagataeibacter xylinus TaxID=28448 RepID=A0A318PJR2_KOMXY|nr:lytic murein transglycosylase [Komagataeibacter xylinus]AZV38177.1 lytic murein transglycosylase [Komagataeibacter xylinus]PYD57427.1 lytic murein transglycosylase [Komagataeibacter xylinus]GBQ80833.1 lytic murein transglycosylase B [Komagataeibacter xylinus NBRC 15237]
MLVRRRLLHVAAASLAGAGAAWLSPAQAARHKLPVAPAGGGDYASFLATIRREASRQGLNAPAVTQALDLQAPDAQVIQRDRNQPEFHLSWAQYRSRVLGARKISDGRTAFAAQRSVLEQQVLTRYNVSPGAVMGIWGLESGYGAMTGKFNVVDALCTLTFEGRRAQFFHDELFHALAILNAGDITPELMNGSYAGAMGQPQFMPSAYVKYAVDIDGDGRRDIWHSIPDIFGSIANYLAGSGWVGGESWGQEITVPDSVAQSELGRTHTRTHAEWMGMGIRQMGGAPFDNPATTGAVLRPDGPGGEAFMVYRNFAAIRRYNPSDFYALAVGLLGNEIT